MSTDVYSYIVIGVPLLNYVKTIERVATHVETTLWDKQIIYNKDGSERTGTHKEIFYIYKGEEYRYFSEITEIYTENKYYERKDEFIDTYQYDYGYINKSDTIGLLICDTSINGGKKESITLEELKEKFILAKKLLEDVGIIEEPTIRLVEHWSY